MIDLQITDGSVAVRLQLERAVAKNRIRLTLWWCFEKCDAKQQIVCIVVCGAKQHIAVGSQNAVPSAGVADSQNGNGMSLVDPRHSDY